MNKRSVVLLLALVFLMISGSVFAYGGYKGSFQGRALLSEEELATVDAEGETVYRIPVQRGTGMWTDDQYPAQSGMMERQSYSRSSGYAQSVHPMAQQMSVRNASFTSSPMRGQSVESYSQRGQSSRGGYQNASFSMRGASQQGRMGRVSYQNSPAGMRGGYASASQTGYRMNPEDCVYLETGERQFLNQADNQAFAGRQSSGRMGYTR